MSTQEFYWPEGENWLSLEDRALGDVRIVAQLLRGIDARWYAMTGAHLDWHSFHPAIINAYTLSNPSGTAYEDMEWGPPDEAVSTDQHWTRNTPVAWCLGWMYLLIAGNSTRTAGATTWAWDDPDQSGEQRYQLPSDFVALNAGSGLYGGETVGIRFMSTARWKRTLEVMRGVIDSLHKQFAATFYVTHESSESEYYELDPGLREWFPFPTCGRVISTTERALLSVGASGGMSATYNGNPAHWSLHNYDCHWNGTNYSPTDEPFETLLVYVTGATLAKVRAWGWLLDPWHGDRTSIVYSGSFSESEIFSRLSGPATSPTPYMGAAPNAGGKVYPLGTGYAPPLRHWSAEPGGTVEWHQGPVHLSPPMNYIESMSGCSSSQQRLLVHGPSGSFTVTCRIDIETVHADNGREVQFSVTYPGGTYARNLTGSTAESQTFSFAYTGSPVAVTVTILDLDAESVHVVEGVVEADLMPWQSAPHSNSVVVAVVHDNTIECRDKADPREHEFVVSGGTGIASGSATARLSVVSWA